MARIVVALGGNALGNDAEEQQKMIDNATPSLIALIKQKHEIIFSHGNGPQVGMINLAFDKASQINDKVAPMDLAECTAMSQGYIGYHLQKGIGKQLRQEGLPGLAATVITQVEVDINDPAFKTPTKPIGGFYDEATAQKLMGENPGMTFSEDAGRGWRRMVASPQPVDIVEKESIISLLDNGFFVIACGGGGVPVIRDENGDYQGVSAVIDKDLSSAKLAETVDADYLYILTAVDRVAINFGKPDQQELAEMTVAQAEQYCQEGHFAPGSMLPKVRAAIQFASSKKGRQALIASLEKAPLAMQGASGTVIHM